MRIIIETISRKIFILYIDTQVDSVYGYQQLCW